MFNMVFIWNLHSTGWIAVLQKLIIDKTDINGACIVLWDVFVCVCITHLLQAQFQVKCCRNLFFMAIGIHWAFCLIGRLNHGSQCNELKAFLIFFYCVKNYLYTPFCWWENWIQTLWFYWLDCGLLFLNLSIGL